MIWGAEKIEKKDFKGPSPGKKKFQEAFLAKKSISEGLVEEFSKGLAEEKKFLKRPCRGKKT